MIMLMPAALFHENGNLCIAVFFWKLMCDNLVCASYGTRLYASSHWMNNS